MKLKGATIDNMTVGGVVFTDVMDFVKALKASRNIIADVYINGHCVGVGNVSFTEENGWLNASLNTRLSLDEPVLATSILVKVHEGSNKEDLIMSTMTLINEYLEVGDQHADLHFTVLNIFPYSSLRKPEKPSYIRWLRTHLIKPEHLESLPTDPSVVIEDPEEVEESVQATAYYPSADDFTLMLEAGKDYIGEAGNTLHVTFIKNAGGDKAVVTVYNDNEVLDTAEITPESDNITDTALNTALNTDFVSFGTFDVGYISFDVIPAAGEDPLDIHLEGGSDTAPADDDEE